MIKINWERPWAQAIAEGFFSFALPGLGQLYQGRVFRGIFIALIVGFGTFFSPWFGYVAHAIQCLDAAIFSLHHAPAKDKFYGIAPLIALILLLGFRLELFLST